jgi:hypothetical protein
LSISSLLQIKMNSNCNCSYMTMSSLTYILGFSVIFFKGQSRMQNPEKLATLGTQDTGRRQTKQITQHRKLKRWETQTPPNNFVLCLVYSMLPLFVCCSFLIVPSVYSSVHFVLCVVCTMLTVSLCCSFLSKQKGQSRMNNTETLTTSDTQDSGQNKN